MSPASLPVPSSEEQRAHHRLAAQVAGVEISEFALPEHHHVVLGGQRFLYLDWGTPSLPPALFLHGGGQTARTWDLVCLALRQELHCLALDQRGHGDSEWSYGHEYGHEAHADDIVALLDELEIERAVLVGMSMGCINGLYVAARCPERVAAFVAVDAGPWVQFGGAKRIVDFVQSAAGLDSLDAYVEHAMAFNPRRDPRLLRVSLLHNLRQHEDGTLSWKTDRRRPFDLVRMRESLAILAEGVGELRCPTLVVRGTESDVFSDDDAESFARALPDGRWVRVAGAGHTIQGDQPAALVDEIRGFLASI